MFFLDIVYIFSISLYCNYLGTNKIVYCYFYGLKMWITYFFVSISDFQNSKYQAESKY